MNMRRFIVVSFLTFLSFIVYSQQLAKPANVRVNVQLTKALLKLQRILLALTFEDLTLLNGAFLSSIRPPVIRPPIGQPIIRPPIIRPPPIKTPLLSADYDSMEEEYDDDDDDGDYHFANYDIVLPINVMCIESECPKYNCSSQDPDVVNIIQRLPTIDPSQLKRVFNKSYAFVTTPLTYEEAAFTCCKNKMSLLSIESSQEYQTISDLHLAETKKLSDYWTSGQYLGCPNKYRWCGSMQRFEGQSTWRKGDLDAPGECVEAQFSPENTLIFGDTHCYERKAFICETLSDEEIKRVNYELSLTDKNCRPNCPNQYCDQTNQSPPSGADEICGRRYVYVQKELNFALAMTHCCSLGMRLLSLETRAEQVCLEEYYAKTKKIRFNQHVWTSGSDLGCEGRYGWCGSNSSLRAADGIVWLPGEPNNNLLDESCLEMINVDGSFKINDVMCIQVYHFICEEITTGVVDNGGPDLIKTQTTKPPSTQAWGIIE